MVNPTLAKEWNPTKNGRLTPRDVTPKASTKVWWKCRNGHEWQAAVANRANGRGCRICGERDALEKGNLQRLNPELAKQWHPTRNGKLTPKHVTANSHKKVWWQDSKGHVWKARIGNRNQGTGCPYCSGRYPTFETCLQAVSPALTKE